MCLCFGFQNLIHRRIGNDLVLLHRSLNQKHRLFFEKGDNRRIPGWMQLHYRLSFDEAGLARLYVFRNCRHFIRTLPDGYNMVIDEEGGNISQGEKQLLTIARALLKNPQILILDEATSSVDTRLERMLQEAMSAVMRGRTSFVIAHRLSTIRNADLILVLREGRIVEQGTHDVLMARRGEYARLYNSQFADSAEV